MSLIFYNFLNLGGAVKRQADKLIFQKHDIPDAQTMYNKLKDKGDIQYHYISEHDIAELDRTTTGQLTVKGTMKIHQLTVVKKTCACS